VVVLGVSNAFRFVDILSSMEARDRRRKSRSWRVLKQNWGFNLGRALGWDIIRRGADDLGGRGAATDLGFRCRGVAWEERSGELGGTDAGVDAQNQDASLIVYSYSWCRVFNYFDQQCWLLELD
jgi:hypothetical protein